jgi:hypothetical protein
MLCSLTVDAKNEADSRLDSLHISDTLHRPKPRSEWEDYLSSFASPWVKMRGRVSIPRNVGGSPKKKWTGEEDALLEKTVAEVGLDNWRNVAMRIPDRTGKQCRERWVGHMTPAISHQDWSPEEDVILVQQQAQFGNHWTKIKQFLPGRSNVAVKNRWSWLCRRDVPNHCGEFQEIVKLHEGTAKDAEGFGAPVIPFIDPVFNPFDFEMWEGHGLFSQIF